MSSLKITDLPIDILENITSIVRNKYNEALDKSKILQHNRWFCDGVKSFLDKDGESSSYVKKHQIPCIFNNKGLSKEYFEHYYKKLLTERNYYKSWKTIISKDLFYHFGTNVSNTNYIDNFVIDDITGLDENRFVNDMETCKERTKMYYNYNTKTLVIRCIMPPQEPYDEIEVDWFDTLYYCNDANVRYSRNQQENINKFFNIKNQMKIAYITETRFNGNKWEDCINDKTDEYETQICSFIECPYNKIYGTIKSNQKMFKEQVLWDIQDKARTMYELMKEKSCFKNGGLKYKYKE